ncbi:MAG: 4-hydroxythreonine-4-phosphate dehydrogenase PdxA [Bacteroidales bacterium]|nr:4-hydroxythreonine-4-phosphate dehydrogenase PdxA [Bacteroidales bacterium]
MSEEKIKIGITHGDINGIGYEIIIKALMDPRILELCIPVVYGSPKVAAYHRKALNIDNFSFNSINSVEEASEKRANIINCNDEEIRVELGKSTPMAGEAAYQALEAAVKDLRDGKIQAIVTAPINKHNIQSENFPFSGHTEYLQTYFDAEEVVMLMVSNLLKVGVVSGHIPLKDVPAYITKEKILSKLRVMNQSLKEDFGIRGPRIAVLSLNPHAGDNGLIGTEETDTIIPAIEQAKKENIIAVGPYPSDGFFGSGSFSKFDAVLAMYHDQGLIPFKALANDEGVNFTAGIPVVRTSPAHGTAYDIAGKNEAEFNSFLDSIYLACDVYRNRNMYKEINKNPLPAGLPEELQGAKDG